MVSQWFKRISAKQRVRQCDEFLLTAVICQKEKKLPLNHKDVRMLVRQELLRLSESGRALPCAEHEEQ